MHGDFKPLGFLGAGFFAELILTKLIQAGIVKPSEILAGVRRHDRARELHDKLGVTALCNDNATLVRSAKTIFLCVRPNQVRHASEDLKVDDISDKVLISIVGGVTIETLRGLFPASKIFRVNPNPQILTGHGFTAYAASNDVTSSERNWVEQLFDTMGETIRLEENQLNMVSALSGVTHTLYFYECLMEAALYLGLSEDVASKIVFESISGSMALLKKSGQKPASLIRQAATPGGIGVEKLYVLDKLGFKNAVIESIKAALIKAGSLNP